MGTWGCVAVVAVVVGAAVWWDVVRQRRLMRQMETRYEAGRRENERLQKRVDETIAQRGRLTSTRWPAPAAPAARPARSTALPAPSARPAPAVDEPSWPGPAPAFAASATDSAPARHGGDDSHHLFSAGGGSFDGGGSSGDWSSDTSCSSSSSSDSSFSSCSSD